VVSEGAEVAVAPAVVGAGAGPPVVAGRLVEVVARDGAEVVVELGLVVAVTEAAGAGRVPGGPEPFELATLAAGGGRTST
jgi:hypothetical protein